MLCGERQGLWWVWAALASVLSADGSLEKGKREVSQGPRLEGGKATCSEATSSAQRGRESSLQLEAKGAKLWARSRMRPGLREGSSPRVSVPRAHLRQPGATTGVSQLHLCPPNLLVLLGSGGFQWRRRSGWAP